MIDDLFELLLLQTFLWAKGSGHWASSRQQIQGYRFSGNKASQGLNMDGGSFEPIMCHSSATDECLLKDELLACH